MIETDHSNDTRFAIEMKQKKVQGYKSKIEKTINQIINLNHKQALIKQHSEHVQDVSQKLAKLDI